METTSAQRKDYELTKEILNSVKDIEGFPIGKDEDIIELSAPLHFTMCPNPWIENFIGENGKLYDSKTDNYHREPFTFDISEGKNDPIYNAHSYHTKVPHKAIMRYILHYTRPNDIVFDGFCGTGMTGVAAQLCGTEDEKLRDEIGRNLKSVEWGVRKSVLGDLSPAATFIAHGYNIPISPDEFERECMKIIAQIDREYGWMYETNHTINGKQQYTTDFNGKQISLRGKINYTVWSDIFICPQCSKEIIFWEVAFDKITKKVKQNFNCSSCDVSLNKDKLDHVWTFVRDDSGNVRKITKQIPVMINYSVYLPSLKSLHRFEKIPDDEDLKLITKIEDIKIPYWYPNYLMMFKGVKWGDTWRAGVHAGISSVNHFYTKRSLITLSSVFNKIKSINNPIKLYLIYTFEQAVLGLSKMARYVPTHYSQVNQYISGTLYIGSLTVEPSLNYILNTKIKRLKAILSSLQFKAEDVTITTQSNTCYSQIPSNSIDYIFTDPPFGGNLMYSELNFLWESWLNVYTNTTYEAIVNVSQKKGLWEYQNIMEESFKENYRILKPGRWMTVEFHNSQNSVWIAIQEALMRAGFVVADVRTLDKQQGSFKQVTSTSAVKQDLVISAYKPNSGPEKCSELVIVTEEASWNFINNHLKYLPVFVENNGIAEILAERQNYILYDRMIAFHVQRAISVPISASDFYVGLHQRFPERDGMYFLPEQVVEYDKKRMQVNSVEQLSLHVHDEKSAIQWIRQQLEIKPQTYQDLSPKFVRELYRLSFEKLPELLEILDQNFLQDNQHRWYIPNPDKKFDLEKLREKMLLKEFEIYKNSTGKLKVFRIEAIRAGFKKSWLDQDYKTIIEVSKRLPDIVLQEDSTLLMYYDNSSTRYGE